MRLYRNDGERSRPSYRITFATATGVLAISLAWWLTFLASARRSDLHVFIVAGSRVLHGHTPYLPLTSAHIYGGSAFVYPAVMAWLFSPFSLLPFQIADAIFFALSIGLIVGSLYLLGVRHPVAYLAVLAAGPTIRSLQVGAINALLLALLALAWRFRERWPLVGLAIAGALVSKLFLAPMVLWLVVTRRFRAAVVAGVVSGLVVLAGCWSTHIGVTGFRHLLSTLGRHESVGGYSIIGQLVRDGLPYPAAQATGVTLALVIVAYGWRSRALVSGSVARDAHRFVCCLVAALVASPIVWSHYLLLLVAVPALSHSRKVAWVVLAAASWIPVVPASGSHWLTAAGGTIPSWLEHGIVYVALMLALLSPRLACRIRPPRDEVTDHSVTSAAATGRSSPPPRRPDTVAPS